MTNTEVKEEEEDKDQTDEQTIAKNSIQDSPPKSNVQVETRPTLRDFREWCAEYNNDSIIKITRS